jgi:hypothetical protein
MSNTGDDRSPDLITFQILAYEFEGDEPADAEKKIRRKFRSAKVGPYHQGRVDYLRKLKNDLRSEITLFGRSRYFRGASGAVAGISDFDVERMTDEYAKKYPEVGRDEMGGIIGFALYVYYLL